MNSFYGGKVGPQGDCVKNILEVLASDCGARNDSNTKKYILENFLILNVRIIAGPLISLRSILKGIKK